MAIFPTCEPPKKTCGSCMHWYDQGGNPMDLAAVHAGECRGAPPCAQLIPDQRGQFTIKVSFFPMVPSNGNPCALHSPKVTT